MFSMMHKSARTIISGTMVSICLLSASEGAEEMLLNYVLADRLERQWDNSATVLDLQGWVGKDLQKFWWKAEGEYGDSDRSAIEAFYSKAHSAYFDIQFGLRQEFGSSPSRTSLAIGLQGLAPQWFELDTTAYLADDGDLSLRFEAEYELLMAQRLVLQPRIELTAGTGNSSERGLGSGLRESQLGLRLRYEIRRKIAPYIGITWNRAFGNTKDMRQQIDDDYDDISGVVGLRFWF